MMIDKKNSFGDLFKDSLSEINIEKIERDKTGSLDIQEPNIDFVNTSISLESLIPEDYSEEFKIIGVQNKSFNILKKINTLKKSYATIDLHNCESTLTALNELNNFFRENYKKYRYYKIIHGKGLHNKDGSSPMRTMVRKYLINSCFVLAYTIAEKTDGGDGATYVLIKQ